MPALRSDALSRRLCRAALVYVVAAFLPVTPALSHEYRPVPVFGATSLPTPPRQAAPFEPPAVGLPLGLTEAAELLFSQGMADPRGCDYRQVEVGVDGVMWSPRGLVDTHAWVLPASPGEEQRFAVCWNGLVYPVRSVGDKADVREDVEAAVATMFERLRDETARRGREFPRSWKAASEYSMVSHTTVTSLKACLLWRLGEPALAERVWEAFMSDRVVPTAFRAAEDDPYLMLAVDWTWCLFDRAVCSFMRGDDRLARVSAERLRQVLPAVSEEAFLRGMTLAEVVSSFDQIPALIADLERRALEPAQPRPLDIGLDWYATQDERIAALIRDLDQVDARQIVQPGRVEFYWHPVIQALIAEGRPALEPLTECIENDRRLTRSVHFWRDFSRDRTILIVPEAANAAAAGILGTDIFDPDSTADNLTKHHRSELAELAGRIRALAAQPDKMDPVAGAYEVLRDEAAGGKRWLEAAQAITRPADVVRVMGLRGGHAVFELQRLAGQPKGPDFGSLRTREGPSVTELLRERAMDASVSIVDRADIALCLAEWEPRAAMYALQEVTTGCILVLKGEVALPPAERMELPPGVPAGADFPFPGEPSLQCQVAFRCLRAIEARIGAGDGTAGEDYAALLAVTPWEDIYNSWARAMSVGRFLDPLVRRPEAPVWRDAAAELFAGPRSGVFGGDEAPATGRWYVADLGRTAAITVPAFRALIADALRWSDTVQTPERRGRGPEHRVCDLAAAALSRQEGMPPFEPDWPEARRNAAVGRCLELLQRYGGQYRVDPASWAPGPYGSMRARLMLPVLERPASEEDVRDGRAVFALDPARARHVVETAELPMRAVWTGGPPGTHESAQRNVVDPLTGSVVRAAPVGPEGWVWQAEEKADAAGVARTYGFIGRDTVAAVPASEVLCPPAQHEEHEWLETTSQWAQLSHGIVWRVGAPGQTDPSAPFSVGRLDLGDPVTLCIWLHNRSGWEQDVPLPRHAVDEPATSALPGGLRAELLWTGELVPGEEYNDRGRVIRVKGGFNPDWEPVPQRAEAPHVEGPGRQELVPGETRLFLGFDLGDYFSLDRPGTYRLVFEADWGDLQGRSNPVLVSVRPRRNVPVQPAAD